MASKEQIWAVADELLAETGKMPILAAVRDRLGGGSYTDISLTMQTWRSSKQPSAAPLREPPPASITERLSGFGGELWAAALELANGRLAAEREALEAARQEAEQIRQEAVDLADQLAAELDKAQAEISRQAEQLTANTAEAARAELQARVEQLTALLEREQTAHVKAAAEAKASGEQNAELRARLDAGERRTAEIEVRAAAAAEQAAAQARKEAENARIAEQSCQARLESAVREIEGLRVEKADAEERYRKAADSAAMLQGQLEGLNAGKELVPSDTGNRSTKKR